MHANAPLFTLVVSTYQEPPFRNPVSTPGHSIHSVTHSLPLHLAYSTPPPLPSTYPIPHPTLPALPILCLPFPDRQTRPGRMPLARSRQLIDDKGIILDPVGTHQSLHWEVAVSFSRPLTAQNTQWLPKTAIDCPELIYIAQDRHKLPKIPVPGGKPPRPKFNGVVMETVDSSCLIVTERGPVKSHVWA